MNAVAGCSQPRQTLVMTFEQVVWSKLRGIYIAVALQNDGNAFRVVFERSDESSFIAVALAVVIVANILSKSVFEDGCESVIQSRRG